MSVADHMSIEGPNSGAPQKGPAANYKNAESGSYAQGFQQVCPGSPLTVVALDLSLTATGVALPGGGTRTITSRSTGVARLDNIWTQILHLVDEADAGLVVIEGYSMGTARQQSHAHALGELGGVVRHGLYLFGTPYVDVAPASLKKYATGVGNASKEQVLVAAVRRLHYEGHDHNQADALWLQQMAWCHYYGNDAGLSVAMPAKHREALLGVAWPAVAS